MSSFHEERRRDRAAEREQDRIDRREQADRDRQARAEREERARRDREDKRRAVEERRATRKRARRELWARLVAEGDTITALIVMACSIIPAVYFQLKALGGQDLPTGIAIAIAVMLESGTWVATFTGERAKRHGRPTLVFRTAMWGCAGLAAAVNYSHAPGPAGGWLAWVLAAASMGGVFFWELRGLSRRESGRAGRTLAERRADRARARHRAQRRRRFPEVWKRYRDILAAYPHGAVDLEDAWRDAWRDVHGADLSVTAPVMRSRLAADAALADVLAKAGRTPESVAVDLLLDDLFGSRPGDDGPSGSRPGTAPGNGPHGGDSGGGETVVKDRGNRFSPGRETRSITTDTARLDTVRDMVQEAADRGADLTREPSLRSTAKRLGCRPGTARELLDTVLAERGVTR
ncbi:DUF2637 domain-containing protein [Streptomyces sp. NPDC021218]|uniref:DUF2637 domain-containing protein n=1 Tax=Streptomyces sp. NPDC021218 TaxID=3365119 RepID=UPI00379CB2F0